MNTYRRIALGIILLALMMLAGSATAAPFAYITNYYSNTVSVIDTATNTVTATIDTPDCSPWGVAVNPAGTRVYTGCLSGNNFSVIDTATNTVTATLPIGGNGVAVNPEGTRVYVAVGADRVFVIDTATNTVNTIVTVGKFGDSLAGVAVNPKWPCVYVANFATDTVSVIDTTTNTVITDIPVGDGPRGVAVNPEGTRVYVTNYMGNTVTVIDTPANTVKTTVNVGSSPLGVAVNPVDTIVYVANAGSDTVSVINADTNSVYDTVNIVNDPYDSPFGVAVNPSGTRVYVANYGWDTIGEKNDPVSVIDTGTNTVIQTVTVGDGPIAFGLFIGPEIPVPIAAFTTNVNIGEPPLTVEFTDESTGAITMWQWSFGDGAWFNTTELNLKNPVHDYSSVGVYYPKLIVCNAAGCDTSDQETEISVVVPDPEFPSVILPAVLVTGFFGIVLYIRKTREK